MYFLTSLVCAIIAGLLWFFLKDRKALHLDILAIIFGASTLMWMVDCFATLFEEGVFLSFDDPMDGWISLFTVLGGIFLWLVLSFILNNSQKVVAQSK